MSSITLAGQRFETQTVARRVGQLGIAFGIFAVWLTLPPFRSETSVWPILVAVVSGPLSQGNWHRSHLDRAERRVTVSSLVRTGDIIANLRAASRKPAVN